MGTVKSNLVSADEEGILTLGSAVGGMLVCEHVRLNMNMKTVERDFVAFWWKLKSF